MRITISAHINMHCIEMPKMMFEEDCLTRINSENGKTSWHGDAIQKEMANVKVAFEVLQD